METATLHIAITPVSQLTGDCNIGHSSNTKLTLMSLTAVMAVTSRPTSVRSDDVTDAAGVSCCSADVKAVFISDTAVCSWNRETEVGYEGR